MENNYIDIISVCVTALAMIITFFTLLENRKLRLEQGQADIFVEVMQINFTLYLVIHNIGETYANKVEIIVSEEFVNRFSNLTVIPPRATYRYSLLEVNNIDQYPPELYVEVSYCDRYTLKKAKKKIFVFNLIDYIHYDISYNSELKIYDINKTY